VKMSQCDLCSRTEELRLRRHRRLTGQMLRKWGVSVNYIAVPIRTRVEGCAAWTSRSTLRPPPGLRPPRLALDCGHARKRHEPHARSRECSCAATPSPSSPSYPVDIDSKPTPSLDQQVSVSSPARRSTRSHPLDCRVDCIAFSRHPANKPSLTQERRLRVSPGSPGSGRGAGVGILSGRFLYVAGVSGFARISSLALGCV